MFCDRNMRRVRNIRPSTLQKQEVSEIGLNMFVPGLGMGTTVFDVQARGMYSLLKQRLYSRSNGLPRNLKRCYFFTHGERTAQFIFSDEQVIIVISTYSNAIIKRKVCAFLWVNRVSRM